MQAVTTWSALNECVIEKQDVEALNGRFLLYQLKIICRSWDEGLDIDLLLRSSGIIWNRFVYWYYRGGYLVLGHLLNCGYDYRFEKDHSCGQPIMWELILRCQKQSVFKKRSSRIF